MPFDRAWMTTRLRRQESEKDLGMPYCWSSVSGISRAEMPAARPMVIQAARRTLSTEAESFAVVEVMLILSLLDRPARSR